MRVPTPFSIARLAGAALVVVLAAGCSILPKSAPVQVWQPEVHATASPATANANFSLRVDTPNANGSVDQLGITVLPKPGEVSTYHGARWNESPTLLVRQRLVDAFMAAKLPAVTTDDDHFASDYTLSGDLRKFQSEYRNGAPVVVVRFDALLRRGGSRRPFAAHSFVISETPSGVEVPQIVAAFGTADDTLAQQVVAWTVDMVSHATATPAADTPTAHHH
ncbi:MAG TPA: ABC-type transport auxiliary lipoprotein family protein [Rhodanobacteraceae bacterium]